MGKVEAGSSRNRLRFGLLGLAVHLPDDLVDVDDLVGVLLQHLLGRQAWTVASVPVTQTDCRLHMEGVECMEMLKMMKMMKIMKIMRTETEMI